MTNGRASLLILAQRIARTEIAARCGVTVSVIHDECAGRRVPSRVVRARLQCEFGIPGESWRLAGWRGVGKARHAPDQR